MNKTETAMRFKYLCNSLFLFAMDFSSLVNLDSDTFDIEFELSSEFEIGFESRNLDYLSVNGVIGKDVMGEILEFKSFVLLIPDVFWKLEELENPIWNDVRNRANAILDLLDISDRNYDFNVTAIIERSWYQLAGFQNYGENISLTKALKRAFVVFVS